MTETPPFEGPLPEGWSGGAAVTKYYAGAFLHLYRVTRSCKSCHAEISIDVTKRALLGQAKNAGLQLRNCPKCRADRKAGGPGSRGGLSRPVAEPVESGNELERLRTANATMTEELSGVYARNKELFAEVQVLKARLAVYELAPAMQAAKNEKMPF